MQISETRFACGHTIKYFSYINMNMQIKHCHLHFRVIASDYQSFRNLELEVS
jgi:hypothetical protein